MACTSTDNAAAVADDNDYEDDDVANLDESMCHMSFIMPSSGEIHCPICICCLCRVINF
jgi:hypothetical protein